MKTEFWVSFNYGAWEIRFRKDINLPFTPFIGMTLFEDSDDGELLVRVKTDDYTSSDIMYYATKNCFVVCVSTHWKRPITANNLDNIIENFLQFGWFRDDHTDIDELKKLMQRNIA